MNEACDGDEEVRREVESLLNSHNEAESFMEQPAAHKFTDEIVKTNEKLIAGQNIAHYEIIKPNGAGMGEVYRSCYDFGEGLSYGNKR